MFLNGEDFNCLQNLISSKSVMQGMKFLITNNWSIILQNLKKLIQIFYASNVTVHFKYTFNFTVICMHVINGNTNKFTQNSTNFNGIRVIMKIIWAWELYLHMYVLNNDIYNTLKDIHCCHKTLYRIIFHTNRKSLRERLTRTQRTQRNR